MADTKGVIELEALTEKILRKLKKKPDEYNHVLGFVIDGVREMNMYHKQQLKYQKFTLGDCP